MKPGLKRIEATLHDLGIQGNYSSTETNDANKRPFSFRISMSKKKQGRNEVGARTNHVTIGPRIFNETFPKWYMKPESESIGKKKQN